MTTPERTDDTRQDPPATVIDTGGCAFPDIRKGRNGPEYLPGMTLRQYYAGQFLAGVANYANHDEHEHGSALAWIWADAMIAAQ